MRRLNKKELLVWSLFCVSLGFISCSDTENDGGKEGRGESSVPLTLRSEGTSSEQALACYVYIFSQTGNSGGYSFEKMIQPAIGGETPLSLETTGGRAYRFLFVATPEEAPEMALSTRADAPVATGTPWEDIVLLEGTAPLSVDNYYGITEMTGPEIAAAGKVEGHLTRLTGQVLFDFYKAGPGGVEDPVAIDPTKAQSVFDRIYQVDITYTGQAAGVAFGEGNRLEPVYKENNSSKQTLHFALTPGLGVGIPQPENGLGAHPSAAGGVRLQGACFLPTDTELRVSMAFHYYDPLPVCGITGSAAEHLHTIDCYIQKEVELNLPALSADGLSIRPDYFTVHKAALPCDRVIDIPHESGINIQTSWNVSNSN